MFYRRARRFLTMFLTASELISMTNGCGTTKSFIATEQLLLSDAVDTTLGDIDFTPLAGHKVFLDTSYVSTVRPNTGASLIASEYLIGSVREKMLMSGCKLATSSAQADLIAELRVGALGTDGHSVMIGIPAVNAANATAASGRSTLPTLPELSVARRETTSGKAKVSVFAYWRETREAAWQSGVAQSGKDAQDTWILGIGPLREASSTH